MNRKSDNESRPVPDLEQILTDLMDYAIDRDELKFLLANWPETAPIKRSKVDYELQILKIIAVGWGLSYYLQQSVVKEPLQQQFWQSIQEFSAGLSETTGLMIGQEIDYFAIIKERLDYYLTAMGGQPEGVEPAHVVGPEFADICGDRDDIFAKLAGGKLFNNVLMRIKQYLEAVSLI